MEFTIPTYNTRRLSKKEQIIENLKWKLRFHEEQAEKIKKQIERLEKGDKYGK